MIYGASLDISIKLRDDPRFSRSRWSTYI